MVIIWSNFAKTNLKDFLHTTSMEHKNAIDYLKSLHKYTECLIENSHLGKSIDYLSLSNVRQLIYKKHRILYCVYSMEIRIIAVINTSQNLNSIIKTISKYFQ
ncbi:MAG: type II toxin-antitoxin system RelE/ParE family toxin [Clostridia bacterium]|nr:type II toxin-antitoxin system RelE/ParE family toxin [Clostridia bacterium]